MSALELLQIYGSEEDSSGEDFIGFGESDTEQFPSAPWQSKKFEDYLLSRHPEFSGIGIETNLDPAPKRRKAAASDSSSLVYFGCESFPERVPETIATIGNCDDSGNQALEMDSESTETLDSDGSFFAGEKRKRKRTKKELQKLKAARSRRLNHNAIMTSCGCSKGCDSAITKDERILTHSKFWNLSDVEQKSFIREHVRRMTVQTRRKNRLADDTKKFYTYVYHIRLESRETCQVCKKFFLNTIGYNENCG